MLSSPFRPRLEALEGREVPATLFALTQSNQIWRFDSATPGTIDGTAAIANLNANERVVGMDFRPRTGGLYALAVNNNGTGTAARLLLVNPLTGASTQVGNAFTLPAADATGSFGFDFNPTVDRIRVVNEAGLNLRLNPNDGTVTQDVNILLGGPVDAAAYDRNFDGKLGANGTTLFTINPVTGNLHTQGTVNQVVSPNTGLQTVVGPLGVAIDPNGQTGFDVAANGTAYALFDNDPTAAVSARLFTVNLGTGAATQVGVVGDAAGNFTALAVAPEGRIATGSGAGMNSRVEVYEPFTGARLFSFTPFPGFQGGTTVAVGDVNRDGVPDTVVAATAGGGPHVKVYDGTSGNEIASFFAYDGAFRGGVNLAVGDVNGDGYADIITGAGAGGGPHVKAFSMASGSPVEIASFFAYDPGFGGGVRVAAGDFNNDGTDELVTAAGPGGGPHVRVFARDLLGGVAPFVGGVPNSFFAYNAAFSGGVWVATGDLNGDGVTDIVTGPDAGGGPHVRGFSGKDGSDIANFFAFGENFSGGARVGTADVDRDGRVEVLVAPGVGRDPDVLAFDPNVGVLRKSFDVVDGSRGAYVGGALV